MQNAASINIGINVIYKKLVFNKKFQINLKILMF